MTGPTLQAAFADNPSEIIATFDQPIDPGNPGLGAAFKVTINDASFDVGILSVLPNQTTVRIPLGQPIPDTSSIVKLEIFDPAGVTNQDGEQASADQIDVVLDTAPPGRSECSSLARWPNPHHQL